MSEEETERKDAESGDEVSGDDLVDVNECAQGAAGADGETPETEQLEERDVDLHQLDAEVDLGVLKDLRNQVGKLQQELAEHKDLYLRALADLENNKKRALKERSELIKYQGERVFFDMLEVIDGFDRATQQPLSDIEGYRRGIELIHKQFLAVLSKWEVRGESTIGKPFDPSRHNAIGRVFSEAVEAGTVVEELKRLYLYKDKILRSADVVVAMRPEPVSAENGGQGCCETKAEPAEAESAAEKE
jgi:molecular chaperone GrpE